MHPGRASRVSLGQDTNFLGLEAESAPDNGNKNSKNITMMIDIYDEYISRSQKKL